MFNQLISDLQKSVIGQVAAVLFIFVSFSTFSFPRSPSVSQTSSSAPSPTPISTPSLTPSSSPLPTSSQTPSSTEVAKVTRIIDGDTIVLDNGKVVRYIGIDAPETRGRGGTECYAFEAKEKNKELVLGKQVRLIKDVSETDRYDRLLRYVYVGNTFINEILVRDGYAKAVTYPPDVKYANLFHQAEQEAREQGRGLWSPTACTTPSPTVSVKGLSTIQKREEVPITGQYTCDCTKSCSRISSCEEAYFQLSQCGCSRRDGDNDGIPCETLCN